MADATSGVRSGPSSSWTARGDELFVAGRWAEAATAYVRGAVFEAPFVAEAQPNAARYADALAAYAVADVLAHHSHPSAAEGLAHFRDLAIAVTALDARHAEAFVRLGIDPAWERGADRDQDQRVDALVRGDVVAAVELRAVPMSAVLPILYAAVSDLGPEVAARAHQALGSIYAGDEDYAWARGAAGVPASVAPAELPRRMDVATEVADQARAGYLRDAAEHFTTAADLHTQTGNRTAAVLIGLRALRAAEAANALDPARTAPTPGHGIG